MIAASIVEKKSCTLLPSFSGLVVLNENDTIKLIRQGNWIEIRDILRA